ncbi:MAG: hypothetical protein QM775_36220 [Pirellulales bacterium]
MSIAAHRSSTTETADERSMPSAPYGDVMCRLVQIERQLRLFDDRIADAPYWEYLRLRVHYELSKQLGLLQIQTDRPKLRLGQSVQLATSLIGHAAKSTLHRFAPRSIVFFGYRHRSLQADGQWHDLHLDPLLEELPWSHVYVRRRDHRREWSHYDPIPTRHTLEHDAIDLRAETLRRLRPQQLTSAETEKLVATKRTLRDAFGVDVDLVGMVKAAVTRRRELMASYRRFFERTRPKLVVVLAPNVQELAAVEAARSLGIRTAELQHGMFSTRDPSYTFPAGAGQVRCFVDDLLLYGDYWREVAQDIPAGTTTHSIGFEHYERRAASAQVQRRPGLVVISQAPIGRALSRFAVELARRRIVPGPIVYRLHPDETDWRNRYPWLVDSDVRVDDGGEKPLYELLAESTSQLGVFSFALFEGLALGLQTFILDLPGAEAMQSVVDRRWAKLVRSPEELNEFRGLPVDAAAIFQPDAKRNFYDYLDRVVGPI